MSEKERSRSVASRMAAIRAALPKLMLFALSCDWLRVAQSMRYRASMRTRLAFADIVMATSFASEGWRSLSGLF
jgi:hypothetical protein